MPEMRARLSKEKLRLVQLPLLPPAASAPTGNACFTAGCLAVAAKTGGFGDAYDIEVLSPSIADTYGDLALANHIAKDEPAVVGFSLYMWNAERSLHVAREVKLRSPNTKIVIGGPEVEPDNAYVLAQKGFDIAVTGEGEEAFVRILTNLKKKAELDSIPGVATRSIRGQVTFTTARRASFPLSQYPSPYLSDVLPIDPNRTVYVEVARGCLSRCSFCFYSRGDLTVRRLEPDQIKELLQRLNKNGAREVSILDPSFNQRSDFTSVLAALAAANPERQMTYFAELKAEGLIEDHLDLLAKAGFTAVEIGMQSLNQATLRRARRGGRSENVALIASRLKERGITPLIDIMVGLPGDRQDDVLAGIRFLVDRGLGQHAQVMALSVLPGTTLRDDAAEEALIHQMTPPYMAIRTDTMADGEIRATMLEAEKMLGRSLDEHPRPHLVSDDIRTDPPDIVCVSVDSPNEQDALNSLALPMARHSALWIEGSDLFESLPYIRRLIAARMSVDPYCILDVVILGVGPFPLDVIDNIREALDKGPAWYLTNHLMLSGANAARRISVVIPRRTRLPQDYLGSMMEAVPVFRDMMLAEALANIKELGVSMPCARIVEEISANNEEMLLELSERADPEAVVFASRRIETWWVNNVVGYKPDPAGARR